MGGRRAKELSSTTSTTGGGGGAEGLAEAERRRVVVAREAACDPVPLRAGRLEREEELAMAREGRGGRGNEEGGGLKAAGRSLSRRVPKNR
jgi:hypothetical protein